jgi:hypothetical protein
VLFNVVLKTMRSPSADGYETGEGVMGGGDGENRPPGMIKSICLFIRDSSAESLPDI